MREIVIAKRLTWDERNRNLNTAQCKIMILTIATQRRKNKMDVEGTNFIKGDSGEMNVERVKVCER